MDYVARFLCYFGIVILQTSYLSYGSILMARRRSLDVNGVTNYTEASLGTKYNGSVVLGIENIYSFRFNPVALKDQGKAIRISVSSPSSDKDFPVLFVARLVKGILSWTVPLTTTEGGLYRRVSRTLCPGLNTKDNKTSPYLFIDVSTSNRVVTNYTLKAFEVTHFSLGTGIPLENVKATPAEPAFFMYEFTSGVERVMVYVESNTETCAVVLIQNTKCPVYDQTKNDFTGFHATMTKKAAVTLSKDKINGNQLYIVLLVKDSDLECTRHKGEINPFSPTAIKSRTQAYGDVDDVEALVAQGPSKFINLYKAYRVKYFTITVESLQSNDDYAGPVVAPVLFFGSFYIIALIFLVISWCNSEDGGRSFFSYLLPSKVKSDTDDDTIENEFAQLQTPERRRSGYGSTQSVNGTDGEENATLHPRAIDNDPHLLSPHGERPDELHDAVDYDLLDDIDKHKDIYRLKRNLNVTDLSRKSFKKLQKKFNIYYWNLLTVAIFYSLPVVQLVLTYQKVVYSSGDLDICYYNFLCARPFYLLSAFNNIYSNIGYIMLGVLFMLLVLRRDRLARYRQFKDPENEQKYGIPKHYGILYAMGGALIMEGILSACYHVCPNYSNFQFDTAFMYIIGLLGCFRLYQTRHHDVHMNAHLAYAAFAVVIFTAVIGVIFRSFEFWIVFMLAHIVMCLYISTQIYYMGRFRVACGEILFVTRKDLCHMPLFLDRFALLVIFNVVNLSLSINGIVNLPRDFATYLLGIIVVNGLLYVVFYLFMKLRLKEKIKLVPLICMILSIITWACSLVFFIQGLSDWQLSPAQSREGNKACRILDFYDDHDIWHFLSATAMFFSFLCLMTLDDDLDNKERNKITVF